jgi:hypothetical protein
MNINETMAAVRKYPWLPLCGVILLIAFALMFGSLFTPVLWVSIIFFTCYLLFEGLKSLANDDRKLQEEDQKQESLKQNLGFGGVTFGEGMKEDQTRDFGNLSTQEQSSLSQLNEPSKSETASNPNAITTPQSVSAHRNATLAEMKEVMCKTPWIIPVLVVFEALYVYGMVLLLEKKATVTPGFVAGLILIGTIFVFGTFKIYVEYVIQKRAVDSTT